MSSQLYGKLLDVLHDMWLTLNTTTASKPAVTVPVSLWAANIALATDTLKKHTQRTTASSSSFDYKQQLPLVLTSLALLKAIFAYSLLLPPDKPATTSSSPLSPPVLTITNDCGSLLLHLSTTAKPHTRTASMHALSSLFNNSLGAYLAVQRPELALSAAVCAIEAVTDSHPAGAVSTAGKAMVSSLALPLGLVLGSCDASWLDTQLFKQMKEKDNSHSGATNSSDVVAVAMKAVPGCWFKPTELQIFLEYVTQTVSPLPPTTTAPATATVTTTTTTKNTTSSGRGGGGSARGGRGGGGRGGSTSKQQTLVVGRSVSSTKLDEKMYNKGSSTTTFDKVDVWLPKLLKKLSIPPPAAAESSATTTKSTSTTSTTTASTPER